MNREEGAYMEQLIKEKSRLRKTVQKFKLRELLIKKFIDDLYWEYDRMSSSGTETLDKLANTLGMEEKGACTVCNGESQLCDDEYQSMECELTEKEIKEGR